MLHGQRVRDLLLQGRHIGHTLPCSVHVEFFLFSNCMGSYGQPIPGSKQMPSVENFFSP